MHMVSTNRIIRDFGNDTCHHLMRTQEEHAMIHQQEEICHHKVVNLGFSRSIIEHINGENPKHLQRENTPL